MYSGNCRCVRVLYTGRVQGVGFRYMARTVAQGYEIRGFVKNLSDGRVEMMVEGTEEELGFFLQAIQDSGLGACIRGQEATWTVATGQFKGFEIVR